MKNTKKTFVTIGHIVNDTEPYDHIGGGVSYSSIAARRLGYTTHVITKCPTKHPYVRFLENLGIRVHILPSNITTMTSFRNIYSPSGKRKQVITNKQDSITINDLKHFPKDVLDGSTILVAPVIAEVDMELYPYLASSGLLAVTPQGYFRALNDHGVVHQKEWDFPKSLLNFSTMTIFSDEDITVDGKFDNELLNRIKKAGNIVALTKGAKGARIYEKGKSTINTMAYKLYKNETRDFTGAGDIFATALITRYADGKDLMSASAFAAFYAALKISGSKGIGVDSIPTTEELSIFVEKNSERIKEFREKNNMAEIF